MNEVWIVERGDYENRHIAGVYATAEAAMAAHPDVEWKRSRDHYQNPKLVSYIDEDEWSNFSGEAMCRRFAVLR